VFGYLSVSFYENALEECAALNLPPKISELSLFVLWWIVPIVAFYTRVAHRNE
jgi:hypothetical protein